jgi:hypothetical protein
MTIAELTKALDNAALYAEGFRRAIARSEVAARQYEDILLETESLPLMHAFAQQVIRLKAETSAANIIAQRLAGIGAEIQRQAVSSFSQANLNNVLKTLNQDGWQCLLYSGFRPIAQKLFAGTGLDPLNFYQEIDIHNGYPNGLRRLHLPNLQTQGDSVETDKYAGGFPAVRLVNVEVSGTITVTGTARLPNGTLQPDRTWVTASPVSGTRVVRLVPGGTNPAPANSLITSCSAVTKTGGGLGTIYVVALRPSGRPRIASYNSDAMLPIISVNIERTGALGGSITTSTGTPPPDWDFEGEWQFNVPSCSFNSNITDRQTLTAYSYGPLSSVTEITFTNQNLVGTLPPLGRLTGLERIVVTGSPGLGGQIHDISNLSNLVEINLSGCSFSAGLFPLPVNLENLNVTDNEFSGVIFQLPQNIVSADFTNCKFRSLAVEFNISNRNDLIYLSLTGNLLSPADCQYVIDLLTTSVINAPRNGTLRLDGPNMPDGSQLNISSLVDRGWTVIVNP